MLFVPNSPHNRMLVHEIRSSKPLYYSRPIGYVAPLTRGAAGKAILAFLSDKQSRQACEALDEPKRRKLRLELERIRKERHCVASGEMIEGALSIAAPIFGHDAVVLGAVGIVGPELRNSAPVREKLIPELMNAVQ
jgi:DNA-binding IclR family transcriptional regulator